MGRGPKPAKSKVGAKPPVSRKSPKNDSARVRDLEKRLAEALKREAEAQEQQTATAEILRVISQSQTDVQPVFETMAANALQLCDAAFGAVFRFDGELIHLAALNQFSPGGAAALRDAFPMPPGRGGVTARAILTRDIVHVTDVRDDAEYVLGGLAQTADYRSILSVPMLRDGHPIGAITVAAAAARPFPDKQIALLQTFADQAVIAIENVRLFTELQEKNQALTAAHTQVTETLEQRTATSDILSVIASSPTDIQPVFHAIAKNARRLLHGHSVSVTRLVGDELQLMSYNTTSPDADAVMRAFHPIRLERAPTAARTVRERTPAIVSDIETDPAATGEQRDVARARGFRSFVYMPMVRDDVAIGVIAVTRQEPGRFTDGDLTLLKTFADQAVIAIENVRLFNETKEALEQQTATGEILRVIARSPTDVQPVFDAIVGTGARLCEADFAMLARYDGTSLSLAAYSRATNEEIDAVGQVYPMRPTPETLGGRTILERAVVHIPDVSRDPAYGPRVIKDAGWRTGLGIPLLREDAALGAVGMWRRDVRPFTDRQVELLKTFADQAVIAIENVRLFKELEKKNQALTRAHAQVTESLEQQTATSEILRVIAASPTDVQPVFDTIAASALRLCAAKLCTVFRFDGSLIHLVALEQVSTEGAAAYRAAYPALPSRGGGTHRAILTRQIVHIPDIREDPEYELQALARANDFGCVLSVPMLRGGQPVGAITVGREAGRSFSDEEIELLKTFASQALIAIENVRLFTELQEKNQALSKAHAQVTESLEQQTATADILRVISQSPTDVQPVFDEIVRSALQLLAGVGANVARVVGDELQLAAFTTTGEAGDSAISAAYPMPIGGWNVAARAVRARGPIYLIDTETDSEYQTMGRGLTQARGVRSIVAVPMISQSSVVGTIAVSRREPGSFSDKDIALLQTFADQAVIAIENVRLFKELQTSNRDLTTALDKQTATSDILRVISRSQTDVKPVFDAILACAVRLLRGHTGALTRVGDDQIELVALTSTDPAGDAAATAAYPQSLQSTDPHPQVIRERTPLNIADARTDSRLPEATRAYTDAREFRSWVVVPLLRQVEAVGAIGVTRREPGGFTDDEIALLATFADQAVIAIENVRLFKELEARTQALTRSVDELTALGEVGRAVGSTLDLETVLSTIVSRAIQLSGTDGGSVYEYDEATEEFSLRASRDLPEAYVEQVRDARPRKGEGAVGRVAQTREPVQISDISDPAAYESRVRNTLLHAGLRALLAVPLVAEDQLVGALIVMRKRTGTFAAEEVTLLQTFATQSALAIQNARLFREIEAKSRQLEVASQHKSEFLANMSHELRTPLNAIIGFSEVLSEKMFGELNERQEEYSKDIHASGQHLLSLINDILDLSKIEAGRMELELSDFHLPTALDSALTLVRERAGRRGITLQIDVDSRLGQMQADERKVRQVVLNLLSNAIKFTPEGGRIEVQAAPKDGLVEVSVSDTGVGIAPEDQEAVFEEFRQVGTADKKVEGTGLGLTLCRKFVELHGGKIWVKSQVGVGSTFTFTIPLRPGE